MVGKQLQVDGRHDRRQVTQWGDLEGDVYRSGVDRPVGHERQRPVFQLPRGEAFGVVVGDLLQLECALEGNGVPQAAGR